MIVKVPATTASATVTVNGVAVANTVSRCGAYYCVEFTAAEGDVITIDARSNTNVQTWYVEDLVINPYTYDCEVFIEDDCDTDVCWERACHCPEQPVRGTVEDEITVVLKGRSSDGCKDWVCRSPSRVIGTFAMCGQVKTTPLSAFSNPGDTVSLSELVPGVTYIVALRAEYGDQICNKKFHLEVR